MMNALLIAALCVIWGATWVAIKIGLSESPPFYGAALRFVLAALILTVFVRHRRPARPQGPHVWRWIVITGVLMYFGSYATVYYVEQYINAALAAILFASFPFFVAIGAHYHLPGERLTPLKVFGLAVGFAGVVLVLSSGIRGPGTTVWWAPALMLLSPLASAIASVFVKKHLTREDPFYLNCVQMVIGVGCLLPMALIFEDFASFHWNTRSVGAVLFLGTFGSAFAFVTLYHLLRTMTATGLSLIAFVTPVVATILGWLVLDEALSWTTGAGALLVFAGIWIVNVVAGRVKTSVNKGAGIPDQPRVRSRTPN